MHYIEIEPTHVTSTGQRYRVWHDGKVLIEGARVPICEAARKLFDSGKTGVIRQRRKGNEAFDMEAVISNVATLTVTEGQSSSVRFSKWSSYERNDGE